MALAKLISATVDGIEASPVSLEVDVASGLPGLVIVGLADKAVEESRERVRSAIKHSGFSFPLSRITIHLAPSEKRKSGVHFDVGIAIGILLADGQIRPDDQRLRRTLLVGGLSLDGQLQSITGTLVLVEWAKKHGFETVALPVANWAEARLIDGIELLPFNTLTEILDWLGGGSKVAIPPPDLVRPTNEFAVDWQQIRGQEPAKRALLVAAAGGHNILLEGPPGAGKTLLARGLRALLPRLNRDELIEVVKIHSVAGQLRSDTPVDAISRPFRSPHHSASQIALVGGGSHPRPGEISLAHHGVLFLDELPEFPRSVIEALRQPLEDGEIFVNRIAGTICYPARFLLVATMNPCPCGWLGSQVKECCCSPHQVNQYRKKVSGPILDRLDVYLRVPPVSIEKMRSAAVENSELDDWRAQINQSHQRQRQRNDGRLNARLPSSKVGAICQLDSEADQLLSLAAAKFHLSGRGYHKTLKLARTIADLQSAAVISPIHLAEALQYRFFESDVA